MGNSLYEKLHTIQQELKAPKDLRNNFGGYNYRSCESILEALKPLLKATKTAIVITDDVVECGGRIYVKASATLYDVDSGEKISNSAFAREEETKKGMDGSQITGAASSYARKYAMNGLLCIDDNKDSDATNDGSSSGKPTSGTVTKAELIDMFNKATAMQKKEVLDKYKKDTNKEASSIQFMVNTWIASNTEYIIKTLGGKK